MIRVAVLIAAALQAAAESSMSPSLTPHVRGSVRTPLPLPDGSSKKGEKRYKRGIAYEQDFNMLCQTVLAKERVARKLTQEEYAAFVWDYCDHAPNRGARCIKRTKFAELPVPVQQIYATSICSFDELDDTDECLRQIMSANQTTQSFDGDIQGLCKDTYNAMQQTGMLADLSGMPSLSPLVTSAPYLRPTAIAPVAPVQASEPTSPPAIDPTPDNMKTGSTPQPSEARGPNGIPEPEPEKDTKDSSEGESMSSKGIAFTAAAVAAIFLAKALAIGAYFKLRKQKKMKTIEFDPYLQEHSALGSEHSFSLTFDEGGDPLDQRHRLIKPCEQITVMDPLARPTTASKSSVFEERSLSLATSIFDERLLPHVDGYKPAMEADFLSPLQASIDETDSQSGSGTINDPIPITMEPTEAEDWRDSREKWRLSRDEMDDLTVAEDKSAHTRRRKRRERDNSESHSVSSSNSSQSTTSIAISIKRSFQIFDESVSDGIEMLRNDLSEYDAVDSATSQDTADDSISVHISRRAGGDEPR